MTLMNFSDTEWSLPQFLDMKYLWLSIKRRKKGHTTAVFLIIKQNLNTSFRKRNQIYNTDNMHIWIQNASR